VRDNDAFRHTVSIEQDAPLGLYPDLREIEQPFDLLPAEREVSLAHEGLAIEF
jgi:hypothetical protein